MDKPSINDGAQSIFEQLKHKFHGTECWDARELMRAAGYEKWSNFKTAIDKAMTACRVNGEPVEKHFLPVPVKITATKGRPGENYLLTRTACYYVFQNGDPTKPEIAGAQAYFIQQTRLQEITQQDRLDARRVTLHNKVLNSEDSLTKVASMHHDLKDPQRMHAAGNEGLYNLPVDEVEYMKGVEEGQLYDYIDSPELAAHYFRITQTEVQLENDAFDGYHYDQEGLENVAKGVGMSVRSVMRERGRTLPEELAAVEDIQPIKKRLNGRELELIEQESANNASPPPAPKKPSSSKQVNGEDDQTALFT